MNIYIIILTTVSPKGKYIDILYVGFSLTAANLTVKEYVPLIGNKGYIHLHQWRDEEERSIELVKQF